MHRVRRLNLEEISLLNQIDMSYASEFGYRASRENSSSGWTFRLIRERLDPPFAREYDWDWSLEETTAYNASCGFVLVAEEQNRLDGMIEGAKASECDLEIVSLFVSRRYRRKGIGKQLLLALEQAGKAAGMKRLTVTTQASDGAAIDFYLSVDFELVGLNCKFYGDSDLENGETAVFLQRSL